MSALAEQSCRETAFIVIQLKQQVSLRRQIIIILRMEEKNWEIHY